MALYDIVFNGGGAKGMAFVGALETLEGAGHQHRRLIGTSAGAITATMIGAGYSPRELFTECTKVDPASGKPVFAAFMDPPANGSFPKQLVGTCETMTLIKQAGLSMLGMGLLEEKLIEALLHLELYRELFSFNECGGFYAGDVALNWIRQHLVQKGFAADVTWAQFDKATGKDVSVVTTDVTEKEMVVLNVRTAPNIPVAESVRMSMSIPFVWQEMVWKPEWGQYLGRDKAGHIFVDGGVLSNFPLRLIAEGTPDVVAIMGDTDPKGALNLGLYLDASIMVPGAEDSDTRRPRLRAADRVTQLIDTLTDSADLAVMRQYGANICRLPVGGYGTTEFRMSSERQELLIGSGKAALQNYFAASAKAVAVRAAVA
ncbi:MAG TPA: patatin-like phospholipase family protein [Pseudacidobacterium sp.]|nr:patatin-like phospholipase family protein [Pseudacidobacterium sp.]